MWLWLLIALFFLILLALIFINAKVNGGFKIETSWIAIALSPAIVWLIATGQLTSFSGFGFEFKLKEASAKSFSLSLEGDEIDPVSVPLGGKEGIAKIPELKKRRVSALSLQVNRRGYYNNWAIGKYLEELTPYDFFRYVVFIGTEGKFSGMIAAHDLLHQMKKQDLNLVKVIEEGAIDRLAGVITVSISNKGRKRDALTIMDEQQISELPVVNEAGHFIGIVERDKLTSSILLQLISQL
ncbi:MAG: CBS domain-containing protein [Thermodesulfobacteriota bacterium]|nr:CBS domain-containing protein [Thermodesulfobacteriota bacterium]